jgi:peroxiredoxin
MHAKHLHQDTAMGGSSRQTRAQRRAAERAHAKEHVPDNRWSRALLVTVAGILAVGIVVIAGYATIHRAAATPQRPAGLADVAALDPNTSLVPQGMIAPGFHLRDANGKTYSLWAQHGHPVLLEFFAVWCPVCHRETPAMTKLEKTYVPKGVRVWAVLANPYGQNYELSQRRDLSLATRDDLGWYARNYNARYPLLVDPKFATVNRYGAGQYPTLYVIDSSGKVSYARSGLQPYSTLSRQLDRALASK